MFLEVTFDNDTTLNIDLSNSHTIQVIGPNNTIENAFALGGVKSVSLQMGTQPVTTPVDATVPAPAPAPTDDSGNNVGPFTTDPITTANPDAPDAPVDPTPADPSQTSAAGSATPSETTTPSPEPGTDSTTASDATSSTPSDSTATPSPDPTSSGDLTHEQVADAAAATVAVATDTAADPTVPVETAQEFVAQSLADVETALGTWPDSPELQDAKSQLTALAAKLDDTTPAA